MFYNIYHVRVNVVILLFFFHLLGTKEKDPVAAS